MVVEVTKTLSMDIRPTSQKKYDIVTIRGRRTDILFSSDKQVTSFSKQNSGKKVIQYLEKKIRHDDILDLMRDDDSSLGMSADDYKQEYIQRVLSQLEHLRSNLCGNFKEAEQVAKDEQIEIEEIKQLIKMGREYPPLYQGFKSRCIELGFTPLEFITKITDGLGVGLSIEVLRAFFGFLQTYLGYKGTNVIAVGSQASGKSHIIDTALRFIPQERVHYGVKSVAYFFRKYNHMDLTGHIFAIGDLGGEKDNEETIRMRDLLKQLSTDGYIERGVVDNANDNVAEEQWVKGYPCLCYTTANEKIINEQEKSRSIIITPPYVDPSDLMTFKAIMNNQGSYASEIEQVNKDVEFVQGLVHYLSLEKSDVDIFNVYLYDIVEYIGQIDDFNRKVDEFNSILKLSCTLNKAKVVYHREYDTRHPLILASKQDVRTALTIFDSNNNLLPNEVRLINGIFKEFDVYNVGKTKSTTDYEESVKYTVGTLAESKDVDWLSENNEEHQYFFTERYLKSEFGSRRWYRANRNEISQKIMKLYDNNYLICIGEDNHQKVFAINGHLYDGSKVNRIEPNFSKDNLDKGKELLLKNYKGISDELNEFLEENRKITKKSELFFETLMQSDPIYNLGWLD